MVHTVVLAGLGIWLGTAGAACLDGVPMDGWMHPSMSTRTQQYRPRYNTSLTHFILFFVQLTPRSPCSQSLIRHHEGVHKGRQAVSSMHATTSCRITLTGRAPHTFGSRVGMSKRLYLPIDTAADPLRVQ